MGIGVGLGISYFLGNTVIWVFVSWAIALATETSLRTVRNVKAPPNPVLDKSSKTGARSKKIPLRKPPKPNF
jgi:hypothetical protein